MKFYKSVTKGLKLKVRKFWGLVPAFVEVTKGKLVGGRGAFSPSPILNKVNVVERTNIPKFSKGHDIVNPLRFLESFFDNALVNMIVGYNNLYRHREKAGIIFEITN